MEEVVLEEKLKEQYGFIFEPELLKAIMETGKYRKIPDGDHIIEPGQPIQHMPLLLNGIIKVLREDENGDEILLYYLEIGDTCAMTMNCCLGNKKSDILAVAEGNTEMILIPVQYMNEWISKYDSWRAFVFDSFNVRLKEMLETIDSIAFMQMDQRLLKYLRDQVKLTGSKEIKKTHQQIATDLHTSRVVVSRLLKKLENNNEIELHRNRLKVLQF